MTTIDAARATDARATGRTVFNAGWAVRPKATAFQELGNGASAAWVDVTLPHDALLGTARDPHAPHGETSGYFRGGAFEYRTSLPLTDADQGKLYALDFDGVYRDAGVTVNGAFAGQHAYGYSRFVVRIDPFLNFDGDNEIRVDCRAHLDSRWYTGAGITRDVHLIVKEPTRIALDGIRVTTPDIDTDRAIVVVDTRVENDRRRTVTASLESVLLDAAGTEVARACSPITLLPGDQAEVRQRISVVEPSLWSPEHPHMYEVRSTLHLPDQVADVETTAIGIRAVQLDPLLGLRLNGEPIKLRGACIHADNGPLGAAAITAAEERKIRLLKHAGFNAIRSSHHPASAALLDACDRLGMLVIDEAFDMWTSAKSDFDYAHDFPQWWERDLEAMVSRAFNHPSVVFYSIGNEIPETGNRFGARWGRRLTQKLRELDPTRFVTNGVNGFVSVLDAVLQGMQQRRQSADAGNAGGVNQMMADFGQMMASLQRSDMVTARTEESLSQLDAAGLNYGTARYDLDADRFPDRIIIGTETYASQIDDNWSLVTAHPQILGDFTWTGIDYLGETGIGLVQYAGETSGERVSFSSGYPGLTAWCGDLDITGHRRPQSYYREIVFGRRTSPYIAVLRPDRHDAEIAVSTPWSWSDAVSSWSWPSAVGNPVRVEVYADADAVELLLNGELLGRASVGAEKAFRADFEVTYTPGRLEAVAYRADAEIGRTALQSATGPLTITATTDRDRVEADTHDLAFVELSLTDADGTVQNTLDRQVTISVTGPATLQGLGSANPVTAERFDADTCRTFDGRALAVIRPTGAGTITVLATADDCSPTTIVLTAQ